MFSTVSLADGRILEYADLGDPAGQPLLFFSGTPATGGQAAVVSDSAVRSGVRLVAPSRAGYGESSPAAPGLAVSARDVVELADRLGIAQLTVIGLSGGGPYALAVAATVPDRVTAVAVHAGAGPLPRVEQAEPDEDDVRAIALLSEGDLEGARAVLLASAEAQLGALQDLSQEEFSAALRSMRPPGETWLDRHPEAHRAFEVDFQRAIATFEGYVRDNLAWLGEWDVDLADVAAPVRLVYGRQDRMVPMVHGQWLRAHLPTSDLHDVPGGHGDATFGAVEDTVAWLRQVTGE